MDIGLSFGLKMLDVGSCTGPYFGTSAMAMQRSMPPGWPSPATALAVSLAAAASAS